MWSLHVQVKAICVFVSNQKMLEVGQPSPVVRNKQLEFSNVGGILGEDDVACELGRGKPEREIGRLI